MEELIVPCRRFVGKPYVCNLGYACDGCPFNPDYTCPWCSEVHKGECKPIQEFKYPDHTWNSKMWNEGSTECIDLSG